MQTETIKGPGSVKHAYSNMQLCTAFAESTGQLNYRCTLKYKPFICSTYVVTYFLRFLTNTEQIIVTAINMNLEECINQCSWFIVLQLKWLL